MTAKKVFQIVRLSVAVVLALLFLALIVPEFLPAPPRVDASGLVIPAFPLQWKALLVILITTFGPLTMIFVGSRKKIWLELAGWMTMIFIMALVVSM